MLNIDANFVVRIPLIEIVEILDCIDREVLEQAVRDLTRRWCVVFEEKQGALMTKGFDTQSECAEFVSDLYRTEDVVKHVLKNGIPRKNVKIEVKARFR